MFGPRSLGTLADLIPNCLAHSQFLEGATLDRRVMEEHVIAVSLDDSKAFVTDQLLDFAFWHRTTPDSKKRPGYKPFLHETASTASIIIRRYSPRPTAA
jgi:hypothetical protein